MARSANSSQCSRLAGRMRAALAAFFAVALIAVPCCAFAQFQDLVNQIPRDANAVVILNLEKAKTSPMGIREGWKQKIEKAFEDGLTRVPPHATRFVSAAQLDFENMQPQWESAIADLDREPSIENIAQAYGGKTERILKREAVALPSGAYVVQLASQTVGALRPATRQALIRWLREIGSSDGPTVSEYLKKAAGYSDNAGSEIIMAVDLDGAFSADRVSEYVKTKPWLEKQGADPAVVSSMLYMAKGIRLGVRIGEKPLARIAIDFDTETAFAQPFAKRLMVEILEDAGMKIDDLDDWKAEAKGKEIFLQGYLSQEGLRRVLSVVPSPAPSQAVTIQSESANIKPDPAAASQQHFKAVSKLLNELVGHKDDVKTYSSTQVWFDRYAGKIEKLPILGVDKELVDYSAFVAQQLRTCSQAVKTAGVNIGVRRVNVQTSPDVYTYGYYSGYYGGYGYARYAPRADLQQEGAQRRAIRTEERGAATTSVQQIRQSIIAATSDIRRKMTQKYQVEF